MEPIETQSIREPPDFQSLQSHIVNSTKNQWKDIDVRSFN